jgi:5'-3' exonuclease
MGVPGFFSIIEKKYNYKNIIFTKEHENKVYDELYLDTNCLIHPICFQVYNENKHLLITNNDKLEKMMIKQVIIYIETIINYINPGKLIYIAIDGVAPMAKIKHQRSRRFKSIADNEIKENIAKKHNINLDKIWNNSSITPGTNFMNKLNNAIINYLNIKKKNNESIISKVKYIFSSCYTSGEGEHKILQYIRSNDENNIKRIIYGLDADLLYLALSTKRENIYLLREITEFQNLKSIEKFCFVSIDILKECIYMDMKENIDNNQKDMEIYKENFIQDFIFLGFFLGNDFLPSLPSINLSIKKKNLNGLEILIKYYKETFIDINSINNDLIFLIKIINKKIIIDYNFLKQLFLYLSNDEEPYFKERNNIKKFIKPCESNNSYDIELYKLENLIFKIPDLFELGKINIKNSIEKYNIHYFHDSNEIDNVIIKYIIGLYWVSYYYFLDCCDWLWFYEYHKSPFTSDIYNFILHNENKINYEISNYYPKKYNNNNIIKPLEQLFMVLPVASAYLLPLEFKNLMLNDFKEYFPKKIEQDLQFCNKFWQAIPEIKILEHYKITFILNNIKLSKYDENKKKFKKPYVIFI